MVRRTGLLMAPYGNSATGGCHAQLGCLCSCATGNGATRSTPAIVYPRLNRTCNRIVSRLTGRTLGGRGWSKVKSPELVLLQVLTVLIAGVIGLDRGVRGAGPEQELFAPGAKLCVLVDKVMQPEADWVTEEWMVRAAADAGFNVFSPRAGHERLDEVRRVAAWCRKYNIYHMPWMRGSLTAPAAAAADGKRMLWSSGLEQPLWSPNADEFWRWTTQYIVEYARISRENEHLVGVFLDYENYAPGRPANLYDLSYDDQILQQFAKAKGILLPDLPPAGRQPWLEKQGLHEAFAAFQIEQWRARCRRLRNAVDQINPKFRFCVYPAPGTPFMVQAIYPEWATQQAPLILADASTYGRPGRVLSEQHALEDNRKRLLERRKVPQAAGIPFVYIGGIDPVVRGADPEFCGKNAVMISETTSGYWVFYEGPKYRVDHPEYWKWFTWANRAIATGQFQAQYQKRQTPENWSLRLFDKPPAPLTLRLPESSGGLQEYPALRLRGENLLVLACRQGQPAELVLRNVPVSHYKDLLAWEVRDAAHQVIASGIAPHNQAAKVHFEPPAAGLYWLGASSGLCAWIVQSANVPVALYAAEPLHLIGWTGSLYFHVPEGTGGFSVAVEGSGAETVKATLVDPAGDRVAGDETAPERPLAVLGVPADRAAAGCWQLVLSRAGKGILEDYTIRLDAKLPGVLSFTPEQVFAAAER